MNDERELPSDLVKAVIEACRPRTFEEDVRMEWANFVRWGSTVGLPPGAHPTAEMLDRAMRLGDQFIVEYRKRFDPAVVNVRTKKQ